jgi:hypothetical protein
MDSGKADFDLILTEDAVMVRVQPKIRSMRSRCWSAQIVLIGASPKALILRLDKLRPFQIPPVQWSGHDAIVHPAHR